MIDKLKELQKNSYCPYSNFPVSAIVVMKDGREFSGVNVENASYGATICAERVAILSAVAAGYRKKDFHQLHLLVGSGKIGTPCFLCRQVIEEFFEDEDYVYCYATNNTVEKYQVKNLCTLPFNEDDLK